MELWDEGSSRTVGGPVSQMDLHFEEEEEEEELGHSTSKAQEGPLDPTSHTNGPLLTNEAAWDTGVCVFVRVPGFLFLIRVLIFIDTRSKLYKYLVCLFCMMVSGWGDVCCCFLLVV